MSYVIVKDKQMVLLGPMGWRQRMFQNEINDLVEQGEMSVAYQIPPVEQGYIDLGEGFEIFPIVESYIPDHDPIYDQLVGPFYTYADGKASSTYTTVLGDISLSKATLKSQAAAERYRKENLSTTITVQGQAMTLDTSRDNRSIFVDKLMMMGESDTVNWKFPEGWVMLTRAELQSIVLFGAAYIQAQFDWENTISSQIDAATTVEELKAIVILPPTPAILGE